MKIINRCGDSTSTFDFDKKSESFQRTLAQKLFLPKEYINFLHVELIAENKYETELMKWKNLKSKDILTKKKNSDQVHFLV